MQCPTRLLCIAAAAAFGAALLAPLSALRAQQPPPPQAAPPAAGDPPARVGRLARIEGTVSFRGPGADQWEPATPNYPLIAGSALWTEPQAKALLEVSASRIALAGGTEFDLDGLDAQTLSATEPQGETFLSLRDLAPGETFNVRTPRGTVTFAEPGRYGVAAGDTQAPTTVTVVDGAARMNGSGFSLVVQSGQTLSVTGTETYDASIGPAVRDPFLVAILDERPPAPSPQSAPPPAEVAAMPGAEVLQAYGAWQPTPQYGTVWYPQVTAGWVPYRQGHWAYVLPWGWTWIDDAPWGFAPFHYGRWVNIGNRWGWAPVYAAPGFAPPAFAPVYAPALVSFFGVGAGLAVGVGLGASVGWVPLGWNEPFHPWYHGSPAYVRDINRRVVANVANIRTVTANNFANRGAVTMVPATAMAGSRPIGKLARTVTPQEFATLRPASGPPVRPTAATAGVTPTVARQLRLPAAPHANAAPGPAITPARPGGNPPVTLRTPEQTARPGTAAPPHPPAPPQQAQPQVQQPQPQVQHPQPAPRPAPQVQHPAPPQPPPPAPHPAPQVQHPPPQQPPPPAPHPAPQVQHPPPPQHPQPPPRPAPQAQPPQPRPEPQAQRPPPPPPHPAPQAQPRPAPERQPAPQKHCNPGETC